MKHILCVRDEKVKKSCDTINFMPEAPKIMTVEFSYRLKRCTKLKKTKYFYSNVLHVYK